MPRNGSGNYTLPAGNPVVTGTVISSTVQNSTMNDVATALTNSIAKNGETIPTANLPMAGFKFTNVGVATTLNQYSRTDQVQNSAFNWLSSVTGTNIITGSASPTPAAYSAGQSFSFLSAGANTGAVTINISGIGAKNVTKNGSVALSPGDIPNGAIANIRYDGTQFQLENVFSTSASGGTLTGALNFAAEVSVASAATTDIGAANSNNILITGNTTITSFGTVSAGTTRICRLSAALTITYNATSLILPGAANISALAGDCFEAESLGSGNWVVRFYQAADGGAISGGNIGIQGSYKNLRSSANGTTVFITDVIDQIIVQNSAGKTHKLTNVSITLNTSTVGVNGLDTGGLAANTFYNKFVIWNGVNEAALASLSATSPLLPPGYTYFAYTGSFPTDPTINKFPLKMVQRGKKVEIIVDAASNVTAIPRMISGIQGDVMVPTWVAVPWANYAPSSASALSLIISGTTGAVAMCAPTNSYGAYNSATNAPPLWFTGGAGAAGAGVSKMMIPVSSNLYFAANGVDCCLCIDGWEDNLL